MSEHGKRQHIADGDREGPDGQWFVNPARVTVTGPSMVTGIQPAAAERYHKHGPSSDPADVEHREMRAADEHAHHAYRLVRGCPLCEDWLAERRRRIEETDE